MKITKIETFKFWVDWSNWMFVRIDTDEGVSGWGEASLHGAVEAVETAIGELAPHLVGEDPAGPERHWHRLYNAWRWRGGATMMTALGVLPEVAERCLNHTEENRVKRTYQRHSYTKECSEAWEKLGSRLQDLTEPR